MKTENENQSADKIASYPLTIANLNLEKEDLKKDNFTAFIYFSIWSKSNPPEEGETHPQYVLRYRRFFHSSDHLRFMEELSVTTQLAFNRFVYQAVSNRRGGWSEIGAGKVVEILVKRKAEQILAGDYSDILDFINLLVMLRAHVRDGNVPSTPEKNFQLKNETVPGKDHDSST